MIVAVSENGVIGSAGKLPWRIPADLQFFKRITMGNVLVMGRKTFDSIGKPLPGRETIVVSRSRDFRPPGVRVVHDLDELHAAIRNERREIFVCGGAEIYRQLMPECGDLFLTRVKRVVEGDTRLPEFESAFERVVDLEDTPEITISHWVSKRRLLA